MEYRSSDKITTLENLRRLRSAWRLKDHKVVFTNGCFDLLHLGHIDYLEKASLLGTKLIVGINSDASVKRIKGEDRPILDERSRSKLIAALEFVSAVILFDEETPLELIHALNPDVLVKGDDYTVEEIVGHDFIRENGGEVLTLPLLEGYSTSKIIQKIRQQ